jgi:RNA-directed DNA polymerase
VKLSSAELFQRILENTPFSERELALLVLTAPTRYKDHYIEKRHGRGKRLISQPTAELKLVQRWLVHTEMVGLPIDSHATAYKPGCSIRDHVQPHVHSHFLLKLDFKDFFPSLTDCALRHRLQMDANYSELETFILIQLLFRKPRTETTYRLSIGAPSSPFLSNYLMVEFDRMITDYCKSKSLAYTRYADDIAISTGRPGILDKAKEFVDEAIQKLSYLDLKLNPDKTVNVSTKYRRELVGLVIANQGYVSLGREEKRRLRAAVHALANNRLPPEEISRLRGHLAFAMSIDRTFVFKLCTHHGISL